MLVLGFSNKTVIVFEEAGKVIATLTRHRDKQMKICIEAAQAIQVRRQKMGQGSAHEGQNQ